MIWPVSRNCTLARSSTAAATRLWRSSFTLTALLTGRAFVPSGASTGRAEAFELRDGDPARYDGRGVLKAVAHVNQQISAAIVGLDPAEQATVDGRLLELDGTPGKSRLGANALLAVSLAAAHAGAAATRRPLYEHLNALYLQSGASDSGDSVSGLAPAMPLPMTNMISGGLHAGGNLDFQDFLILPVGATCYSVGLEWIVRVHRRLGELLSAAGHEGRLVADEGGFGPRLASNRQAAEFIVRAIEAARLVPGRDVALGARRGQHALLRWLALPAGGDRRFAAHEQANDRPAFGVG